MLADKDEVSLVKFGFLDIPAIDNDFVAHQQSPQQEPEEMHRACSKLHMQTWSLIFTDLEKVKEYKWDALNPEIFPAHMSDDALAKIPPLLSQLQSLIMSGF